MEQKNGENIGINNGIFKDSWMRSMDESGISRVLGTKNPFVHFSGRPRVVNGCTWSLLIFSLRLHMCCSLNNQVNLMVVAIQEEGLRYLLVMG